MTDQQARQLEQAVAARHRTRGAAGATAIAPRRRLAATARPAPRATSAATTTSGSTTARPYVTVERPEADVDHRRPAERPRAGADCRGAAAAGARGWCGRRLTNRRAADPGLEGRLAPTTTRNGARSASAVCSGSARRRARPRCRCSTTTCTRSCRRKDYGHDPQRDGSTTRGSCA